MTTNAHPRTYCPTCGAQPGHDCFSPRTQNPMAEPHVARPRIAVKANCEDCGDSGYSPIYDLGGSISSNEPCPSCAIDRLPVGRARCIVKVAMPDHDLEIAAYVNGSIDDAATLAELAKCTINSAPTLSARVATLEAALRRIAEHEYRSDRRHLNMVGVDEMDTLQRIARKALEVDHA